MKVIKPKYYDSFKCIADKCPYSCCIGWKVSVDKKSFQKYRHVQGKMKQKMNQCISRDRKKNSSREYGKIKLDEQGRCSFLNENNLCEMYIELGEESLCTVCKTYPRALYQFGPFCERYLTMSCPEVAHIVLNQVEPMEFIIVDEMLSEIDYDNLEKIEIDYDIQLRLSDIRLLFITIAQYREVPVWKRLLLMRKYAETIDKKVINHTYDEKYLEVLYTGIEDTRIMTSLDKLEVDKETKNMVLSAINHYMIAQHGANKKQYLILENIEKLNQDIDSNKITFMQIEEGYEAFIKDKEIFFEQYIVYYLFRHFMEQDIEKGIGLEVTKLIIFYALIRYFIEARWYSQDKTISQEDMEMIVYSFSRRTEHNNEFMAELKTLDMMKTLENINGCSILLR